MTISDEELSSINRAIHTRYGMDFSNYEPLSFKRRVARIIDKYELESSLGLWRKLINDKDFIFIFIDEITVGLTEMFRNSNFWIKLRKDILPDLQEKDHFSVWHAGCSTGEEVYSMGIMLSEENMLQKAKLVATDLNSQSVKAAQEGIFSDYYIKTYHANYTTAGGKKALTDYYTTVEGNMHFNRLDNSNFHFYQHNLVKDGMNQQFDVIFCRNVMIYFDEVLKMKALRLFYDSLKDDGYFIIGYYDALPNDYRQFFELEDPTTKIFRKNPVLHLAD
ncbi:MAG: protein-glutamate O-methyltransferase CheR [Bacteroidota bacterium]